MISYIYTHPESGNVEARWVIEKKRLLTQIRGSFINPDSCSALIAKVPPCKDATV